MNPSPGPSALSPGSSGKLRKKDMIDILISVFKTTNTYFEILHGKITECFLLQWTDFLYYNYLVKFKVVFSMSRQFFFPYITAYV